MLGKLIFLEKKYKDLGLQIGDPEIINDQNRWTKLVKEHSDLEEVVTKYRQYRSVQEELEGANEILIDKDSDEELKEMARMEISELEEQAGIIEEDLKILLLPKDPNDDKNVIIEIRAGAGGDEAGLFAADLFRMYTRYAENAGWRVEMLSGNSTGLGGFKEVIFMVEGKGAYSMLKYESGVHRVQRIPTTESGGRIHTSTITVAVLPEAEDVDFELDINDIRIDTFRSSGNGGQSVNTTDSAIRVTHIPTGMVVSCQDEKSQHKNKDKALKILRARLLDNLIQEQHEEIAEDRKSQVGTGDRSERIRTYNFPQGRITDHRINLTLYKLDNFMDGDIQEMLDTLITTDQARKMAATGS
ncbi:MAG TPA: peptide chain release factor 1 [Oscillospiraceae bacterium]|nr:peptide chain release factor 1 [Oscillospiraceae bacterium]